MTAEQVTILQAPQAGSGIVKHHDDACEEGCTPTLDSSFPVKWELVLPVFTCIRRERRRRVACGARHLRRRSAVAPSRPPPAGRAPIRPRFWPTLAGMRLAQCQTPVNVCNLLLISISLGLVGFRVIGSRVEFRPLPAARIPSRPVLAETRRHALGSNS